MTAAAVYDHKPAVATKLFPSLSGFMLPDTDGQLLHNFGGEACGGQLPRAVHGVLRYRLRPARPGPRGRQALADEADSFRVQPDAATRPARRGPVVLPARSPFDQNLPALAKSGHRPGERPGHPADMALVAGAIADGGIIMTPHVLDQVTNSQGQVVQTYQPKPWLTGHLRRHRRQGHQPDVVGGQQP